MKIILALDTTNLSEAIDITNKIKSKIFTVKLGLEFFNAHGKEGIRKFNEIGINNLMLDLKLKDIPQTIYKAIKALDDVKFGFITVHGQGGKAMIQKAKEAANEIKTKPKILMVTILTSLDDKSLKELGNDWEFCVQGHRNNQTLNINARHKTKTCMITLTDKMAVTRNGSDC